MEDREPRKCWVHFVFVQLVHVNCAAYLYEFIYGWGYTCRHIGLARLKVRVEARVRIIDRDSTVYTEYAMQHCIQIVPTHGMHPTKARLTDFVRYLVEDESDGSAETESHALRDGRPESQTVGKVVDAISEDDKPCQRLDVQEEADKTLQVTSPSVVLQWVW